SLTSLNPRGNSGSFLSPVLSRRSSPKLDSVQVCTLDEDDKSSVLQIQLLHEEAKLPVRGTENAIGYDIYSPIAMRIAPTTRAKVPVGFAMTPPKGTYGRIAPRSSLSANSSIDIGAGVIDPDYTGEIKVLIVNNGDETFMINKGDRIAQLIVECAKTP